MKLIEEKYSEQVIQITVLKTALANKDVELAGLKQEIERLRARNYGLQTQYDILFDETRGWRKQLHELRNPPAMITTEQAAQRVGVSRQTIANWVKAHPNLGRMI